MNGAAKVGMLVIGFVACFVGAYAVLDRSIFRQPTDEYTAAFKNAGGVVTGAPVMFSGVRVGQVSKVTLERPGRAVLKLELRKGTPIPVGTEAVIASSLIGIGDRPIELVPPDAVAGMLPPGSELEGSTQSPLESLSPESKETLLALNDTLKATQSLLQDQQLKGRITSLLDSSNKTMAEFGSLAAEISKVVVTNQGQVRMALVKAGKMMDDLSMATAAVARIAGDGKLEGKMNGLLDEMNKTLKESNLLVADLRKTMNDPELQGPVKNILANTESITTSGTKIAANAEVMAKNGVTLSEKAIEIADKASKLADDLSDVLKKFDKALGGVAGVAGGAGKGLGTIGTEAVLTRETNPGRFRTDFEAKLPIGKDTLYLGMYDAFEGNKLIAQFGRPFASNALLRYGVYASKPGLGVEYRFAPGATLRGDLFDVNNPQFDIRARFDFNRDISGWLGVEKVFDKTAPSFGIGIKR